MRHWSGRGTRGIVAPIANAALLEEWNEAIPRPAWWDDVPPQALAINSLGDLFSIWQSGGNDTSSHHRFYKLVYQAILDHSGDEHLVAEGVGLMAFVADPDDRFPLLKFGVDHFFSYQQRTDTCANCKVGDTSAGLVRDLADAYTSRRRARGGHSDHSTPPGRAGSRDQRVQRRADVRDDVPRLLEHERRRSRDRVSR